VAQEVGDPGGVPDIGFASGHGFDVLGVDDPDREERFQEVIDRFPKFSRTLHRDMGNRLGGEPLG
jgi:hypothetical protein